MSQLKSLKFTSLPNRETDPVLNRRKKLIDRLMEQKRLAEDPSFIRTVQKWTKKDGERLLIEERQKVHPWWRDGEMGSLVLFVRQGWKSLEFEKGKAGIAVGSKDQLGAVIDTLITATQQGELDDLIAQASKAGKPTGKQRKAA